MIPWTTCTIGDQITLQRGVDITKKEARPGNVPVISSSGPASFHDTAIDQGPGVIIGRKGSLGTVHWSGGPYWPHDTTLWIKDFKGNVRKFVFYFMTTLDTKGLDVGSSNPTLNRNHVHPIPVSWPPLPEQREIAAILGALDDKIEVNRKTSALLEEMARALYRSWFVTFDPITAAAEGLTPAHLPPELAALFPASFQPDGLPEGWREVEFGEFYEVLETGKRPKGGIKEISEGVPSIGAESVKRIGAFDYSKTKLIPREYFESMRKGRLTDGDILIYKDGGKPGELRPAATYVSEGFPFAEACINEHVFRVRLKPELGQHFGFLAMSSESCMDQMRERATGVAQPGLNQSAMNSLTFIKPDRPEILQAFNSLVQPLLDGCNEKAKESQTLAALRDSLLPRLMSGELRVGAARELVEEVA